MGCPNSITNSTNSLRHEIYRGTGRALTVKVPRRVHSQLQQVAATAAAGSPSCPSAPVVLSSDRAIRLASVEGEPSTS